MQFTIFRKCLYAEQLIWFVNKMELLQCTYMDWCVCVVACMQMKAAQKTQETVGLNSSWFV